MFLRGIVNCIIIFFQEDDGSIKDALNVQDVTKSWIQTTFESIMLIRMSSCIAKFALIKLHRLRVPKSIQIQVKSLLLTKKDAQGTKNLFSTLLC